MEVKEIEKVLLHTDDYELRQAKARAKKAEADLNNFITLVQGEIERKLSPDEAEAVKDDALNWLESSLTFPLPNAEEKMRYDALGIDIWLIRQAWEKRTWGADRRGREWEFTFKDGSFHLNDEQPLYNAHYKYATPKQLDVLKQSQDLAYALNAAIAQGLHIARTHVGASPAPLHKLRDTFRVIRYNEKENKVVPDLEIISRM